MSSAFYTFSLEHSLAFQVQISLKVSKVVNIFILLENNCSSESAKVKVSW